MAESTFDIALSFCAEDEGTAVRLHALLHGRLTVFLYSRQQEMLAGTDGESTFNDVFGKQARLVVVLFREKWGKTSFTRIEETAIRNRAYERGYDFTVFIPVAPSETQKVPDWLPKNRLYVGLERWGIEAAAAVIEARFCELGGTVHEETIADLAARAARDLEFKRRRELHLSSDAGVAAQRLAYASVLGELHAGLQTLQQALPGLHITPKQGQVGPSPAIVVLSDPVAMLVGWRSRYSDSMRDDADLEASLWEGHPPWPGIMSFDPPRELKKMLFKPDLRPDGEAGWTRSGAKSMPLNSKSVADDILKFFLERAQGRS